jgi:hypothetical protein
VFLITKQCEASAQLYFLQRNCATEFISIGKTAGKWNYLHTPPTSPRVKTLYSPLKIKLFLDPVLGNPITMCLCLHLKQMTRLYPHIFAYEAILYSTGSQIFKTCDHIHPVLSTCGAGVVTDDSSLNCCGNLLKMLTNRLTQTGSPITHFLFCVLIFNSGATIYSLHRTIQ